MKKFNLLTIALLSHFLNFAFTLDHPTTQKGKLRATDLTDQSPSFATQTDSKNSSNSYQFSGNITPTTTNSSNELFLKELNTSDEAQSYPCLSNDALRVYYTHDKYFYVASRNTADSKFNEGKNIFTNIDEVVISGWLTPDELAVYFSTQTSKLFKATRNNRNENFSQYSEITLTGAPSGSLFDASFTPDMEELLIYNNHDRERIVKFQKVSENEYKFSKELNVLSTDIPTGGQLSRDGLHYYVPFRREVNGNNDYRYIYVLTRKSLHSEFNGIEQVKTSGIIGITAYQPTVNADETKMIFVTGSEDLWNYNELCEVSLFKELNPPVSIKATVPVKENKETKTTVTIIGNSESGNIPYVYISNDKKTTIIDYSGVLNIPTGFVLVKNEPVNLKNPVETKPKIGMSIAPNPFSDKTNIEVYVPENGNLLVQAFTMDGQLVSTLYDGQCENGLKIISWIKNGLSNGIYFVKATIGSNIITKKVVVCNGTN